MSCELIKSGHDETMKYFFQNAKKEIRIISPFLGQNTCNYLANIVNENNIKCKLITRFCREDFIQNANSLDGLKKLLESHVIIYALKHLHSKLYLFDDLISVITSANFTYGGLVSNFELGVAFEDEDEIIEKTGLYFEDIWERISKYNETNQNQGLVTYDLIEKEQITIAKMTNERGNTTKNSNSYLQGADLPINTTIDTYEETFSKNNIINNIEVLGGWIKFEADALHRHNPEMNYFEAQNDFTKDKTFFPRKPKGIKEGQKIYLALVSFDKTGFPVPMIVGRAYSEGFKEEYSMHPNQKGWENWMSDYPYFIYLSNQEFFNGPAKEGISMMEIYRTINTKSFLSTYNTPHLPIEELRHYHYQKDKIRITKDVERFVDERLNALIKKYGIIEN